MTPTEALSLILAKVEEAEKIRGEASEGPWVGNDATLARHARNTSPWAALKMMAEALWEEASECSALDCELQCGACGALISAAEALGKEAKG